MKLKTAVQDINEVPEALREYYTQVGDEYVLDADDKDYKGRINEFRTNNINLANRIKEMDSKFKDIDPEKWEEAQAALKKLQSLEDKKLIDEGKVDELIQQRTERMKASYEGRIDKLMKDLEAAKGERDGFRNKLSQAMIDSSIMAAVNEAGVPNRGAIPDILSRARQDWTVNEKGELVPERDGVMLYGEEQKPLTPAEWSATLLQTAGHLFESSSGGGASGGGRNAGHTPGIIPVSDANAVNANLEDIASGKIQVDMTN